MPFVKNCGVCGTNGFVGFDSGQHCIICHGTGALLVPGEETEYRRCGPCGGNGYAGMDPNTTCPICQGLGLVRPAPWGAKPPPDAGKPVETDAGSPKNADATRELSHHTLPRSCASAVKSVVAHLRGELVLADTDSETLRTAVYYFDQAAQRALTAKLSVDLHSDPTVNGWLLHGARHLLATKKPHRERLREIIGRLAQAGAVAPHGRVGTAFARVRSVGAGSYGTVWQAIRLDSTLPVAVKQCHAPDGRPIDPRLIDALRKEAMCLMRLSHESIPRFVACDFDRPDPYLAMQLVEGERLGDWLARGPTFSDRQSVLRVILAALEHAHNLSICHRDLKMENILVAPGPRPYIIDWGGAKTLLPEQQTAMPKFHANIRNSAPEWILHLRTDTSDPFNYTAKQDMWSFGAVAYQVLSDRHPFDVPGEPLKTAENILRFEPAALGPEFDFWGHLVGTLLQKDPDRRPASCAGLIEVVDRAAAVNACLTEILEQVLRDLGDYMVDSDDVLTLSIAGTNATGFACDNRQIHSSRYDPIDDVIHFDAELHFSGDQDDERFWCGDAFTVQVHGTAVQKDADVEATWEVSEYSVDECVCDQLDET